MSNKLTFINVKATMLEACQLMNDKKIRHLPVFDDKKLLVGILSDRDALAAGAEEKLASVKDFMSWPVIRVHERTPLLSVIETLMEKKISAVMVSNDNDEYVGIISTDDLLGHFADILRREDELKSKPLSFYLPTTLF